jgi:hypothetical protein
MGYVMDTTDGTFSSVPRRGIVGIAHHDRNGLIDDCLTRTTATGGLTRPSTSSLKLPLRYLHS